MQVTTNFEEGETALVVLRVSRIETCSNVKISMVLFGEFRRIWVCGVSSSCGLLELKAVGSAVKTLVEFMMARYCKSFDMVERCNDHTSLVIECYQHDCFECMLEQCACMTEFWITEWRYIRIAGKLGVGSGPCIQHHCRSLFSSLKPSRIYNRFEVRVVSWRLIS